MIIMFRLIRLGGGIATITIFGHVVTCHGKQTNNLLRPRATIRGPLSSGAQLTVIQSNNGIKGEGRKGSKKIKMLIIITAFYRYLTGS